MTHCLAILGAYPPPHNGITLHAQRLCVLLERFGVDYVLYNATSDGGAGERVVPVRRHRIRWMLGYTLTGREPAVLILSDRMSAWLAAALMALRGKRVILRLRNSALIDRSRRSAVLGWLCGWILRRMCAVICVNEELVAASRRLGVPADRVHHLPGFLPPVETADDRAAVADAVWDFIAGHNPIISGNGKVAWHNGGDLYGIDQMVELAAHLQPDYPNVGVLFCFTVLGAETDGYVAKLRTRAAELGVADNLLLNTSRGLFLPVLAASDVFVRPTLTDGDANSVREALALGVPTVASDVYARPAEALTCRTGDAVDLARQVRAALARAKQCPRSTALVFSSEDRQRSEAYAALLAAIADGRSPGGKVAAAELK